MFLKSRRYRFAVTLSVLAAVVSMGLTPARTTAAVVQDFSMRTLDGRTVSSADLHGQVVVMAFGASWLPLSRKQVDGLKKLANEYANRGMVVYFVATDSDSPKSKNYATDAQLTSFFRRNELNLVVLRDPEGRVSKQFGVDQLPAFVVLDKEGKMVDTPIGGLDSDGDVIGQLAPTLDKVL